MNKVLIPVATNLKFENTNLGEIKITSFSDNEIGVDYKMSLRGKSVYLVSSTDTAQNIITTMMACDAAKRACAKEVILIIPYLGYSRQDKKDGIRGSLGAKVIAQSLQKNVDRIICLDLHAEQIEGFFDVPIDHAEGKYLVGDVIKNNYVGKNLVLCSPDAGGTKRVEKIFNRVNHLFPENELSMAMLSKKRDRPNHVDSMILIGDVNGKDVLIIDDMVDTGNTLIKASSILKEKGANSVSVFATHAILSQGVNHLMTSDIEKIYLSNSVQSIQNSKFVSVDCWKLLYAYLHADSTNTSVHETLDILFKL